jgi:nitrite reductase/ring-hydroxylating ferredoxin subunit/uncharacterized membrane protein
VRPKIDLYLKDKKWLDGPAKSIQGIVHGFYKALGPLGKWLKDVMHGTKILGHPLHPALTDIPLGAWLMGSIADYMAITTNLLPRNAATVALSIGLVGALGSAVSGYTDFSETFGLERRAALVHGFTMTVVVLAQAVSVVFRLLGTSSLYPPAVGLATFGLVVAGLGMYLGGHVAYGFGTMVDRNAFLDTPRKPVVVGKPEDFEEGKPKRVEAGGMPVMITRYKGSLYAISATCSHAGGPLDEGDLNDDVVECPWHGSLFCITDGKVRGGPATFSQPQLEVRERDGNIEVELTEPVH